MNNSIFRFYRNSFCKALAGIALTGMISVQSLAAMPFIPAHEPESLSTDKATSPEEFRALSYTMHNSLRMMVHLENPTQEKVSIRIMNSHKEVVYRKDLGRPELYVGRYNLEKLPDGDYTLVVQSNNYTHTRSFSLQTNTTRVIEVLKDNKAGIQQEAI